MSKSTDINPWMISTTALISLIIGFVLGSGQASAPVDGVNVEASAPSKASIIVEGRTGGSDATYGDPDAPIVIQEFSDYQCPYCKRFFDNTLDQLETAYIDSGLVRIEFYDYPLSFHQNARSAAVAAHCAAEQNNYWGMHDALFNNYDLWANAGNPNPQYIAIADALKLKTSAFETCLTSGKYDAKIDENQALGVRKGVTGTPGFFINNEQLVGAQPFSKFKEVIDAELAK